MASPSLSHIIGVWKKIRVKAGLKLNLNFSTFFWDKYSQKLRFDRLQLFQFLKIGLIF